jgi:hypothetical protein
MTGMVLSVSDDAGFPGAASAVGQLPAVRLRLPAQQAEEGMDGPARLPEGFRQATA